eukprot:gene4851-5488_t
MAKQDASNPDNGKAEEQEHKKPDEETKQERRRKQVDKKKKSKNVLTCTVLSLDGTELSIEVKKNSLGAALFTKVVTNLDIVDKEYFGLRFINARTSSKCWLNLHKSIKKQLGIGSLEFQFAVKFYEPEPDRNLDEYTRYLLYLQLREDIVYGRLRCSPRIYTLLGSFTAQAEFGDYNPVEHGYTYLDDYQLGPEEVENEPKFLQSVIDLHKDHRGKSPSECERSFLEIAKGTPRYGIDIHNVKDKKRQPVELGVSHKGIILYKDGDPYDSYGWKAVDIVSYKRKRFMLKLFRSVKRKNPRFWSATKRDAKNLYKSAIEHHSFFRLENPDPERRRAEMFIIGSKFRYSDRTLYQLRSSPGAVEDGQQPGGTFTRSPSKRQKSLKDRSVVRQLHMEPKPAKKKPEKTEPDLSEYEEVEVEQMRLDDGSYPPEWELMEVTLPDGTTKWYRKRIVTTTTSQNYVIRKGTEEIPHVLEDKPIVESETESAAEDRQVSPASEREDHGDTHHHEEIVTTTIITETIVTTPETRVEDEDAMAEIRAASKKPSAAVKPRVREDLEKDEKLTTTTTTTTTKVLVCDVDKVDREKELRQRELEQIELKKREEQRLQEQHEEIMRRKRQEEEQFQRQEQERIRREREEFERRQLELQMEEDRRRLESKSPEFQEITLATGNPEFDKEFNIMPDTFLIKSSPLPSKIIQEIDDELDREDRAMEDNEEDEEDAGAKKMEVEVEDNLAVHDTRKAKTLDRKFVRRPPPERTSGFIRRSYGDELDYDYSPGMGIRTMPRKIRKYVPLITKEELVRAYSQGGLHDDSIYSNSDQQEEEAEKSKIEYSLKDASGVEQGESGFVKSLIGRHETIKRETDDELEERRRSRAYSGAYEDDKGVVPTRAASFASNERPVTKKTKVPPPVKTKPVVFHPNTSGEVATPEVKAPNAELTALSPESGRMEKSTDDNKPYAVPEVVTTSYIYTEQSVPDSGQQGYGHIDSEAVERLWGKLTVKKRRSIKGREELAKYEADYKKRSSFLAEKSSPIALAFEDFEKGFVVHEPIPEIIQERKELEIRPDAPKVADDNEDDAVLEFCGSVIVQPIVMNGVTAVAQDSQDTERKREIIYHCEEDETVAAVVRGEEEHGFDWSVVETLVGGDEGIIVGSSDENEIGVEDCVENLKVVGKRLYEATIVEEEGNLEKRKEDMKKLTEEKIAREPLDKGTELVEDVGGKVFGEEKVKRREDIVNLVEEEELKQKWKQEEESEVKGKNVNEDYVFGEVENEKEEGKKKEEQEEEQGEKEQQREEDKQEEEDELEEEDKREEEDEQEEEKEQIIEEEQKQQEKEEDEQKEGEEQDEEQDEEKKELEMTEEETEKIEETETVESKENETSREDSRDQLNSNIHEVSSTNLNDEDQSDTLCGNGSEITALPPSYHTNRGESSSHEEDSKVFKSIDINCNAIVTMQPATADMQTLKRKKRSETEGWEEEQPNMKRMNLSNEKELGRLKLEYDSIVADFLNHGSPVSLGNTPGIVPTQNISVVPAESQPNTTVAVTSPNPPPPDVITHHSDPSASAAPLDGNASYASDAFPSPPPDLVTQTTIMSHPTSPTYVETKEVVVTSKVNPPEVETHTVVINGDHMSKEELERLMSEQGVISSTSETVVTETTVTTTQQIVGNRIVTEESTVLVEEDLV